MTIHKPPVATSDFPPEHQAEALAVSRLYLNVAAMRVGANQMLDKDRDAIMEHMKSVADILNVRKAELESIASTALYRKPYFGSRS